MLISFISMHQLFRTGVNAAKIIKKHNVPQNSDSMPSEQIMIAIATHLRKCRRGGGESSRALSSAH